MTSAKFSMNDNKKTLEPASSVEEKRDVNPTSALGPLLTCMLTSARRTTYRVRQIAWFPWRMHVNRGPSALVGLTSRFSSALDASTSVFLLSFVKNLALIATSSWI